MITRTDYDEDSNVISQVLLPISIVSQYSAILQKGLIYIKSEDQCRKNLLFSQEHRVQELMYPPPSILLQQATI